MKESFSLKFVLNPIKDNPGKGKIFIRLIINRKKAEIATDHIIDKDRWDSAAQQVRRNPSINEELLFIDNEIRKIKRDLVYAGKRVSAKLVKDIYTGSHQQKRYLLEYFRCYYDSIKAAGELASNTLKSYHTTLGHLEGFLGSRRQADILLEHIDYTFIKEFDHYMLITPSQQYNKPMGRNSANKNHTRLKKVLSIAHKENLVSKWPYEHFQLKSEKRYPDFLTQKEIEKLANHNFHGNESLQRVRDIFLFSVYTGLRYSDAMALKKKDIVQNSKEEWCFRIAQEKTKEPLLVPILKPAMELLEKYDNKEREITGYLLPRYSNVKINLYLKTIADLSGISKKMTHHMARHTFATTITLDNDAPLHIVSKLLGHSSIKTTEIYAKVTNHHLDKHMDRLNEGYK
ncbi:site-specific integrase [Fulvivirga kasyanovii]|uniref:Site-specific integrase n=1 Tax=Fulvivirga kasyanovii TaxID=396812 RepID=A0ABW9RMY5_9BACT|nr:site-specific integrase [Fulvivirga kasyanovii]MTI24739.1 site-specific integrase [Fulvivirga kasyanovii]